MEKRASVPGEGATSAETTTTRGAKVVHQYESVKAAT